MLLRLTIVRVFPTCEVVGSLRVRGRKGVNRVPFSGRFHGRPLSRGTYRLLIGARQGPPTGEATIVVGRGRLSAARLDEARQASACVPVLGFDPTPLNLVASSASSSGAGGGDDKGNDVPLVNAAKGVAKTAESLARRAKDAIHDPAPLSSGFLFLIGLLTLTAVALGAFVLVAVYRLRERLLR